MWSLYLFMLRKYGYVHAWWLLHIVLWLCIIKKTGYSFKCLTGDCRLVITISLWAIGTTMLLPEKRKSIAFLSKIVLIYQAEHCWYSRFTAWVLPHDDSEKLNVSFCNRENIYFNKMFYMIDSNSWASFLNLQRWNMIWHLGFFLNDILWSN